VDPAELERLRSPAGRALLDAAVRGLDDGADVLALATALRRDGSDAALVGAALTQARLRLRGRAKFGPDADRMYWTAAGLEQSTRSVVAAHRAQRFAVLGPRRVADLCCGVGGDLVALARAGLAVLAVDSDLVTAAVARANVTELGLGAAVDVRVDDVRTTDLDGCDAAFLDPARRTAGGRRRFDPQGYSPPYSFVAELVGRLPATAAKVAPGIPHDLVPAQAEAEWVSVDGDVKEAALWFGPLASAPGRRRATLLSDRPGAGAVTMVDEPGLGAPPVAAAGSYLHEPDGAVIRAGLVAEVAARLDGWLLDPTIAYVSTDSAAVSPYTRRYAVEEVVPFQLKRLRALLRERGVGDVVVKKRGTAVEPEELRRRLRLDGDGPTRTLILTRIAGAPVVLLTDPAP
jgi:SAM-dependent methyltransferase